MDAPLPFEVLWYLKPAGGDHQHRFPESQARNPELLSPPGARESVSSSARRRGSPPGKTIERQPDQQRNPAEERKFLSIVDSRKPHIETRSAKDQRQLRIKGHRKRPLQV